MTSFCSSSVAGNRTSSTGNYCGASEVFTELNLKFCAIPIIRAAVGSPACFRLALRVDVGPEFCTASQQTSQSGTVPEELPPAALAEILADLARSGPSLVPTLEAGGSRSGHTNR